MSKVYVLIPLFKQYGILDVLPKVESYVVLFKTLDKMDKYENKIFEINNKSREIYSKHGKSIRIGRIRQICVSSPKHCKKLAMNQILSRKYYNKLEKIYHYLNKIEGYQKLNHISQLYKKNNII